MDILTTIAAIVSLGIAAHWLAWVFRIPAIVLLLVFGFVVGPITGFIKPDEVMGSLLPPFVSLSVAVILFEGGLSLKYKDIKSVSPVLARLLTIGVLVSWLITSVSARLFLGLDWSLSFMMGGILTVTGPTVVIPLLRHIRLSGKTAALLKWEGITIDPVGATLAVLIFEAVRAKEAAISFSGMLIELGQTLAIGCVLGAIAAMVIVFLMKRYWIPDYLEGPFTLMIVFIVFALSNHFQHESGLLTVTVMGIILANQKYVSMSHILEFKENLTLILLSLLFIILSARLTIYDFEKIDFGALLFAMSIIVAARPLSVFLSSIGSSIKLKEKVFLACVAPRGIVAASVASVFALELGKSGYTGTEKIVPVTFFVIMLTVLVYGFSAPIIARRLRLVNPNPQGILMAGCHSWARKIALALKKEGVPVILVDTNMANVSSARMSGLYSHLASVLSSHFIEIEDFGDIRRILCLTSNDELNTLACSRFREFFGSRETYQLPYREDLRFEAIPFETRGRLLFRRDLTFSKIAEMSDGDPVIRVTKLTSEFDFKTFVSMSDEHTYPAILIRKNGNVEIFTTDESPRALPDDTVISLVLKGPQAEAAS